MFFCNLFPFRIKNMFECNLSDFMILLQIHWIYHGCIWMMMAMVSSAVNCVDVATVGVKVCFVTCEWNVERRLSSSVHCVQYEQSINTASCAMSENMLAAISLPACERVCVCVCVCVCKCAGTSSCLSCTVHLSVCVLCQFL